MKIHRYFKFFWILMFTHFAFGQTPAQSPGHAADNDMRRERFTAEFSENHSVNVGSARVSYHKTGQGPALVFIHGFPLSGRTWRKIVPNLAKWFTCYAFDVVGFGDSTSEDESDFSSQGQARVIEQALSALNVSSFALMGNDSGGWIARELVLLDPARVTRLVLTNTEIPGHRPPWIPLYQEAARLSFGPALFAELLASKSWRRSGFGFGGVFKNRDLIEGEFGDLFLWPLLKDQARISNALKFLRNMKFKRLDEFAMAHGRLTMPVLLLWGDADPTFPTKYARKMATQFPNARFKTIPGGKLFMHEEQPEAVARQVGAFLRETVAIRRDSWSAFSAASLLGRKCAGDSRLLRKSVSGTLRQSRWRG